MDKMKKAVNTLGNETPQRYDNWNGEFKAFYEYLKKNTATSTMAAVALNIYRPNTCRYKRWLQDSGRLWEVRKGICAVTGFPAQYLSTNPSLKPVDPQAKLFPELEAVSQ